MWNNKNVLKGTSKFKGKAYVAIPGVILDNKGNEVIVRLVVSNDVYEVTGTRETPNPNLVEKIIEEEYDCKTNCTGLAFAKGAVVLRSQHVTEGFLENEGYSDLGNVNTNAIQKGDIGLYYKIDKKGMFVKHAEIATGKFIVQEDAQGKYAAPLVKSKGGIKDLELKPSGKTWPYKVDGYKVFRRNKEGDKNIGNFPYEVGSQKLENTTLNIFRTIDYGQTQDGIRMVTNKDFLKIQEKVKKNEK